MGELSNDEREGIMKKMDSNFTEELVSCPALFDNSEGRFYSGGIIRIRTSHAPLMGVFSCDFEHLPRSAFKTFPEHGGEVG